MNIDITGKAKVFRNERTGRNGQQYINYATSLARKNQDGEWEHASIEVRFRNGDAPIYPQGVQSLDIDIRDGFLTFRKYKTYDDDKMHSLFYIMVKEYTYGTQETSTAWNALDDDDIPW